MKYVIQPKRNPQDDKAPKKFYLVAKSVGNITFKEIAREIEKRSSLTRGDIENVLTNLAEVLPLFLRNGFTVSLDDFCSVHLTIQSDGADTEEEAGPHLVRQVRAVFVSGTELKKELKDMPVEKFPE